MAASLIDEMQLERALRVYRVTDRRTGNVICEDVAAICCVKMGIARRSFGKIRARGLQDETCCWLIEWVHTETWDDIQTRTLDWCLNEVAEKKAEELEAERKRNLTLNKTRHRPEKLYQLRDVEHDKIIFEAATVREIAARCGVTPYTVREWINHNGGYNTRMYLPTITRYAVKEAKAR